jgi:NAD(P)H-hydrate epimerase
LAIARHLHNRGVRLQILLTADPAKYRGEALVNWQIVEAMGLPAAEIDISELTFMKPALVIDAIFGTGLREAPRGPFLEIATGVAAMETPVLAIDIPSGMDCDTGQPLGACIQADRTITFVAEKIGFAQPGAAEYTGQVIVADIGCPRELIARV